MFWGGIVFQNMENMISKNFEMFHDYVTLFLIYILVFVATIVYSLVTNLFIVKRFNNLQTLEFIWTLLPGLILFFIGIPSMVLLYTYDMELESSLTIKISGRQWYWNYSYSDFPGVEFDSYMKISEELLLGELRLLEVDNRMMVPFGTNIRLIVTSGDVIHSWALPALALKVDGNPGYLNSMHTIFIRPAVHYGQCSEICGANHSFMPIVVEVTAPSAFKSWVMSMIN